MQGVGLALLNRITGSLSVYHSEQRDIKSVNTNKNLIALFTQNHSPFDALFLHSDEMLTFKQYDRASDAPPNYHEATKDSEGSDQHGPQPFEIITHLELLSTFHKLRERVQNDESLFDLGTNNWLPLPSPDNSRATLEIRKIIAEKRWDLYVKRAALRFESWWDALRRNHGNKNFIIRDFTPRSPPVIDEIANKPLVITQDLLPPLDVLMIWHSFLLSPRKYLEDCLLQGLMSLWHARFPWQAIHDSIHSNPDNGQYEPGPQAIQNFEGIRPWLNEDDDCTRELDCPICTRGPKTTALCSTLATDLWTNPNLSSEARVDDVALLQKINQQLKMAKGWADDGFCVKCKGCRTDITRDVICAAKFIANVKAYAVAHNTSSDYFRYNTFNIAPLWDQSPLPGTILDTKSGLLQSYTGPPSEFPASITEFFPIVFVETISHVDSEGKTGTVPFWTYSMAGVRSFLQTALSCRHRMLYATQKKQRRANKLQRPTIRRMMAYYNDNPWKFTFDLASAVHRQAKFIHKMQHIDWLHSPALHLTVSRVAKKYSRFLAIVGAHPGQMAVPTLDIDLGWHTDQLTPSSYRNHTISCTGRFIDHDDKVSEQKLSTSFAWTSKVYQRRWKEPYSECTCWYCEAMHASIEKFPGRFLLGQRARGYRRPKDESLPPHNNSNSRHEERPMAHISTHNAVRIQNPPKEYRATFQAHLEWLDKAYQRACQRARKDGRPLPVRRHPTLHSADYEKSALSGNHGYHDLAVGFAGGGGLNGKKGAAMAAGVMAGGVLGVGMVAIALTAEGGLAFEDEPEHLDDNRAGGCVGGACGGGVGWGGADDDGGGQTGACGGGGGTCSVDCGGGGDGGGDDGGGCGGCGGCG